ncbi:Major Facilitator Superfamily protein [Marininema mesophilum]|uniref:Major Facilitator Superfamily protein n=1 Tax=Marininema mesophilum TaxID=1048340 RepID=A0A1H2S418_9BACL|nr:MFS transporter [Marininema mesophilum]SDW26472.1 Major Facilitator Superfamily protein [Marininema mesophilum]
MVNNQFLALAGRYPITIWVRLLGELLTCLTSSMIAPFLAIYLNEKMGNSVLTTMIIIGLQPLADIICTLLGGGLTDRFGRKPIMVFSLTFQLLAMLGYIIATDVWEIAIITILNGVGRSFYIPAAKAQIADAIDNEHRAEVFGLFSTISYIGSAVGPLCSFLFMKDLSLLFLLSACSIFIYLILFCWKVHESAPLITIRQESKLTPFSKEPSSPMSFEQLKILLTYIILSLPISFFYAQTETNFPLFLKQSFQDYQAILSWLATSHALLVIIAQLWLIKRTNQKPMGKVILLSYLLYTVVALIYGFSATFVSLLCAQALLAVAESIGIVRLLTFVSLLAPPHLRGRYFAIYGMHWDLSRMLGPFLGALLIGESRMLLFFVAAILFIIGGLGQIHFMKKINRN